MARSRPESGPLGPTLRRWVFPLLCLALLWAMPHAAQAQIYRCVGAHGEPVFSGQPCGPPAPPPGTMGALGSGFGAYCAPSPAALRQAIAQAFAAHDVNRLAGLILWRGMDQAAARRELGALATWLQQPLAGIATTYAGGAPPDSAGTVTPAEPASGASAGRLPVAFAIRTAGSGAARDFGVDTLGRCWWLSF